MLTRWQQDHRQNKETLMLLRRTQHTICLLVSDSRHMAGTRETVDWLLTIFPHVGTSVWVSSWAATTLLIRSPRHSQLSLWYWNLYHGYFDQTVNRIRCGSQTSEVISRKRPLSLHTLPLNESEKGDRGGGIFRSQPKVWQSQTSLPPMSVFN